MDQFLQGIDKYVFKWGDFSIGGNNLQKTYEAYNQCLTSEALLVKCKQKAKVGM